MLKEDKAKPIQPSINAAAGSGQAFEAMVEAFVHALDLREREPAGHTSFVAEIFMQTHNKT